MIMHRRKAFTPLESWGEHGLGNLSKLLLTGFTLIELLVVMAIISILMSILLPSLKKAKDQAKAAICMSNMRQIGYAANFYAEDHDSRIPRGTGGPIWTGTSAGWRRRIIPLICGGSTSFGSAKDTGGHSFEGANCF